MLSMPAAITTSYAPAITPCATKCAACCDEPHCRSTLVAGTLHGSPAATHALRVTLQPCSPACVTQPPTTSSISSGSRSLRSIIVRNTRPSRSVGCQPASAPLRFPKALRAQSTITASRVIASYASQVVGGAFVRIAVLVKQVPKFEEMELGPDGRLRRDGIGLEMNPYCRRAVSKAVELAAARDGSHVSVFTLGPPAAEDALREAIAWGLARGVDIEGVLITDTAFAGSDSLITASALACALAHEGAFDLVLAGRNSVDADTGQVGPELAELLDLPF